MRPIKQKRSHGGQRALRSVLLNWLPNFDDGKGFFSTITKLETTKMRDDYSLTTPYHARSNVVAENHVKTAVPMIRKQVLKDWYTWDEHLSFIQLSMNIRAESPHNSSP